MCKDELLEMAQDLEPHEKLQMGLELIEAAWAILAQTDQADLFWYRLDLCPQCPFLRHSGI
jgi:hypothetical protein